MKTFIKVTVWLAVSWFLSQFLAMGVAKVFDVTWRDVDTLGYIVVGCWVILFFVPFFFKTKKEDKTDGKTVW